MSKMEQNSGESRSGEAMSIFGQSIDVRRSVRSRRRATQKRMSFSPAVESPAAMPSVERLHQLRAVAERERARAESELSRARSMATELERQIEQANATERSHSRPELQGTRAAGGGSGSSRRKKGPVDVEAHEDHSNSLYVEVMQELDRVKRELRKLQREVKAAKVERDANTPTPRVSSVKREEADDENEGRGIAEHAEPGGSRKDTQGTWTRGNKGVWKDTSRSRASNSEERFATASSSDVGIEPEDEMAMVPATYETGHADSALTIITHHEEHDDHSPLQAAGEAELTSARVELESITEERIRLTNSVERRETARVTEEIDRLAEQEKRASAQVQQLSARLRRAMSKLDAATAADENAEATLAELSAALRQVGEETEVAEKERALTELESRCVTEDAEAVAAEVAAAERRIREAVKELEAARAAEKLKAVVDGAMQQVVSPQRLSGEDVAVTRFEYEYLTGRGEVVRAIAEKKVAAAEAWVEALRAGEREVLMRAEAIEREIGEMAAGEADDFAGQREPPRVGLQRAQTRRRPEQGTSRKTGTPSSSMARKPSPALFRVKR